MVCKSYFGKPYPVNKGGNWTSGYWQIDQMINPKLKAEGYRVQKATNHLVVFMNIGVPGRTGHNYANTYDKEKKLITWFGQSGTNSNQPIFRKLIQGELKGHFFARWNANDPNGFDYLGIGEVRHVEDGILTPNSSGKLKETIKISLAFDSSDQILFQEETSESLAQNFALEKHLEEFIIENWDSLELGKKYKLQEETKDGKRKKFRTDTGEIDIFAISKDEKEHLVIELKRGRASDKVVGQILRYMGFVKDEVAKPNQKVRGLIIGLEDDLSLRRAISQVQGVDFNRYKIEFRIVPS